MLQLIYGRAGSGKTTLIYNRIKEDAAAGRKVLLLVPKQQVFAAEQRLSEEKIPGFSVEACGFDRLCNRIFRQYGGLCYHYIGKGAKKIVLWRALTELSGFLKEYKDVTLSDLSVLSLMQGAIEEMERCRISPEELERSATRLEPGETKLRNKLIDLSAIYALDLLLLRQNFDNPEEDLTRACALMEENDFFDGMEVYIDGFEIYTPQEIEMLTHIFRQARNVSVTVPCLPDDRMGMVKLIRKSERMLIKLAEQTHTEQASPIVLSERLDTDSPELRFLSDHLWNFGQEVMEGVPRDVSLMEAPDVYSEAEAVACEIARLVREEGCRYREIAVILRSTPSYEGILDSAFEKYQIPCFASARTKLRTKPQIRLIGSALAIGQGGWRLEDVIAYLRSGLTGLPLADCDLLEEYARSWKITGRLWYDDDRWSMNPRGFTVDFTDADAMLLDRLEEIRQKLIAPLREFLTVFDGKPTVREISAALYDFLERLGIPDQLTEEEERYRQEKRFAEAQESVQVWDAILSSLDSLVIVAGDLTVSAGGYSNLLFTVFDSVEIGKIPARADEVLLGDPGLIHRPGVRHAFLMGLCEGVFPIAEPEDAIFGDADRDRLEQIGLELEENSESRAIKELYSVYRAVTASPGKLHLSYYSNPGPSVAVFAVKSLFPDLPVIKTADFSPIDRIYSKSVAFEYAAGHPESATGRAILQFLADDPEYGSRVSALGRPIGEKDCRISLSAADQILNRGLSLSNSRIENFVKCPFSYYCKNVLHLREPIRDDFAQQDVGNFMHAVFERFFTLLGDRSIQTLTDSELNDYAKQSVEFYRSRIVRGRTTKRLEFLFDRLSDLSRLLIGNLASEFRVSEFQPTFFELPIDRTPGGVRPMEVEMDDGRTLSVYGRVDRVDCYRKDSDVYVRVVDYKTSEHSFSLEDLKLGLNLQMLIYLFSICKSGDPEFRKKLGLGKDGRILPAGILYYPAKMPNLSVDSPEPDRDSLLPLLEDQITRSGLLLYDEEILTAMDRTFSGKYIPVKKLKDGSVKMTKSLASMQQFGEILGEIREKIGQIGREMCAGEAGARPMQNSRVNACKYCSLRILCRIDDFGE